MSRSPKSSAHEKVTERAADQAHVLRLSELRDLKLTKGQRASQVRARRWVAVPRRGVLTCTGPVTGEAALRLALLKVGPQAALGGVTALQVAGLTGYEEAATHVWVPKSAFKTAGEGIQLHETRRWGPADVLTNGIRRSRPAVATVQAALWARSLRQAALVMTMPIQQRLVRADEVATELERVRRHPFRRPLRAALGDIIGGAHSMGELDFARMCRDRGLPEPNRQVKRRTSQGVIYEDVSWEAFGVTVEINGVGHSVLTKAFSDELRLIDTQLRGDAAVQVSVLTLRVEPDPFFELLKRLLRSRGWPG